MISFLQNWLTFYNKPYSQNGTWSCEVSLIDRSTFYFTLHVLPQPVTVSELHPGDSNSPMGNVSGTIYTDTEKKISQLGTYAVQITVACIFGITFIFGIISYLLLKYCS